MPVIYAIRGNSIDVDLTPEEGQAVSYRASSDEPITLIHDTHVQMLQDKVAALMGIELTREQFMGSLGLDDMRPEEAAE